MLLRDLNGTFYDEILTVFSGCFGTSLHEKHLFLDSFLLLLLLQKYTLLFCFFFQFLCLFLGLQALQFFNSLFFSFLFLFLEA